MNKAFSRMTRGLDEDITVTSIFTPLLYAFPTCVRNHNMICGDTNSANYTNLGEIHVDMRNVLYITHDCDFMHPF